MHKAIKKIHHWTIPHEGNEFRPHAVRHKTLAFYSVLLISVKVLILALATFAFPSPAEFSTITINRIVELTNKERIAIGLPALNHNKVLDLSARKKAEHMIKNNYFAHNSPDDIKPWHWFKEADYNYTFAGENLAMNFIEAEETIEAWMNSPTHKENIVSEDYEDIGIAVMVGIIDGYKTTLVVQHFGKTYTAVSGDVFPSSSPPVTEKEAEEVKQEIEVKQPEPKINIPNGGSSQQVELKESTNTWVVTVIKYAEIFILILLIFVILNLILTMIVRVEIQHKPIIVHIMLVILLALILIVWKWHFIEGVGQLIIK